MAVAAISIASAGSAAAVGETTLVSWSSDGQQAETDSHSPAVSADGNLVAFESAATLTPGDANEESDIFTRDVVAQETFRITLGANGGSFNAAISSDGEFVAFDSDASNLVDRDNNRQTDVFVYSRATGATRRISAGGSGAGNDDSFEPALSSGGDMVAFWSYASNLVPFDTNGRADVFLRRRAGGPIRRISLSSGGAAGNGGSYAPAISASGRFIAFESFASNLAHPDTNETYDVFVRDLKGGTTRRVSVSSTERLGNGGSFGPSIDADGSRVAFWSGATNLVRRDNNLSADLFVRDLNAGVTRRVSISSSGEEGNGPSFSPAISDDGRFVAFWSYASNLVAGDTNESPDVFIHDLRTKETTLVSVSVDEGPADGPSYEPVLSAGGEFVVFVSAAENLVVSDGNQRRDIFRRNWILP